MGKGTPSPAQPERCVAAGLSTFQSTTLTVQERVEADLIMAKTTEKHASATPHLASCLKFQACVLVRRLAGCDVEGWWLGRAIPDGAPAVVSLVSLSTLCLLSPRPQRKRK